jgi:hypothetical protein
MEQLMTYEELGQLCECTYHMNQNLGTYCGPCNRMNEQVLEHGEPEN